MNRRRLATRIKDKAQLIRAASARLAVIADRMEATAGKLRMRPMEFRRDEIYSCGIALEDVAAEINRLSVTVDVLSSEMRPNMDVLTNSSTNPRDYD